MGPDGIANLDYLKQATVCIQQFVDEFKTQKLSPTGAADVQDLQEETHSTCTEQDQVLEELSKITSTLSKLIDVNDVLSGKMKCGHCGASSVGLGSPRGTSEERRKVSEEENIDDETKSSSAAVSRIDSVDSVLFEQHSIKSSDASIGIPEEEDTMMRDEDIVVKSIFNSTIDQNVMKMDEPNGLDQLLQKTILPDMMPSKKDIPDTDTVDDKNVISNILEKIFGSQFNMNTELPKSESPNDVPAVNSFDNFGVLEAFFNESMNGFEPSTSEGAKSSRKRKSTPSKVPKTENGAGYVCPMEGCNKIFKEKGSVHRHFVTHIGMRFNCDQCKASYTQKHALMLHQKIHLNPDAYQCRGCGTNYTTQNGLRLHRQRNPACMELANELQTLAAAQQAALAEQTTESKSIKTEQMIPIIDPLIVGN